jgi:mono/diheme cytochrome c family protein
MAAVTRVLAAILLAAVVVAAASAAQEPQTAETFVSGTTGADIFKTYCGSCHGTSARGDGPLADSLRFRPPDLTLIAKRSQGKFDDNKVYRIIDGREPVKGHGGTDMPVWGDAFKQSVEGYSEKAVKTRIDALVEYLKSIQAK